jgi:hypothetical protein
VSSAEYAEAGSEAEYHNDGSRKYLDIFKTGKMQNGPERDRAIDMPGNRTSKFGIRLELPATSVMQRG